MVKKEDFKKIIIYGFLIRVGLILFLSTYQNIYNSQLYLTDIDYKVYSDSTLYHSPYDRQTYRYSPIISYLMKFNYTIHQSIGKIFFALCDVVAMIFLYAISARKGNNSEKDTERNAILAVKLYSYNPLFIILTVRGSCEGVALALMYAFWYYYFGGETTGNHLCLQIVNNKINETQPDPKQKWISYMIYGLWVHVRVYPIIFLPLLIAYQYQARNKNLKAVLKLVIQLGIGAGGVFISLGAIFYALYGNSFLQETFFYHFKRLDNRHSFSPYFYEIYLNYSSEIGGFSRSLIRIIPSAYIVLSSAKFFKGYSMFYLHFLATYAFVSFNKVITLQYYMWIFGSAILVLPESLIFIQKKYRMGFGLVLQYLLSIIIWIWLSMSLQNDGINHLHTMWLICLFQIYMHIWVLISFMKTIRSLSPEEEKKRRLQAAKRILSGKKD